MKQAIATIKGMTPLSQSRYISADKEDRETADAFEKRTWKNRLHVKDGQVYVPPMALKFGLDATAKLLGMQVPGKGKSTYTKHFTTGIYISDPLMLTDHQGRPIMADDVEGEWLLMNSDGVRGSGKRVPRCYPVIPEWATVATITIMDPIITNDLLEHHLTAAGQFNGLGRFRPQVGGFYGRFIVEKVEYQTLAMPGADEQEQRLKAV